MFELWSEVLFYWKDRSGLRKEITPNQHTIQRHFRINQNDFYFDWDLNEKKYVRDIFDISVVFSFINFSVFIYFFEIRLYSANP